MHQQNKHIIRTMYACSWITASCMRDSHRRWMQGCSESPESSCQNGCALFQCTRLLRLSQLCPCMTRVAIAQCLQDQSAAHRLWVVSYGVLLKLHMVTRTVLNKLVPSVFAPPLLPMLQGSVPYRTVTLDMHTDGMVWAGGLAITAAAIAHLLQ